MTNDLDRNSAHRSVETIKARLERELEELEWQSRLDEQSDDRYYSNGRYRAAEVKRGELRARLAKLG